MAFYDIPYAGPPLAQNFPDAATPHTDPYHSGDTALDAENVTWTYDGTTWSTTSQHYIASPGTLEPTEP